MVKISMIIFFIFTAISMLWDKSKVIMVIVAISALVAGIALAVSKE